MSRKSLDSGKIETILKNLKPRLVKEFGIKRIGYFGSFSRDEPDSDDSDVDILVELDHIPGWEFFELHTLLETELGRRVDLATYESLKKQLRAPILKEVRFI